MRMPFVPHLLVLALFAACQAATSSESPARDDASLTITSPVGGEGWSHGSTCAITWSSINIPGDVRIELTNGGGVSLLIAEKATNSGAYEWLVDAAVAEGNFYKIRISSTAGTAVSSESPSCFSIGTAFSTLTLAATPADDGATAPSGAVKAVRGSYQISASPTGGNNFVRWEATGGVKVVNETLRSTVASIEGDGGVTALFSGINVTIGTTFNLKTAYVPDVDQFSSRPTVYAADGDKSYGNLRVTQYTSTEALCVWTAKATCADYTLMVRVRGKGALPADLGFAVRPPEIAGVSPALPSLGNYATVTGFFFGDKKPQIWLSCANSSGGPKKVTLKVDPGSFHFDPLDTVTGKSWLKFLMPRTLPKNTSTVTLHLKNTLGEAQFTLW